MVDFEFETSKSERTVSIDSFPLGNQTHSVWFGHKNFPKKCQKENLKIWIYNQV